ncbi:hypothetical protein CCYA_CCYA13G3505 [Cyanidiococcus yangmingshanensis]|nr:hypothetical protein CCYA_CCYA13G3505 [Cyanidiococcus yangmingshanensis]
MKLIDSFGRPIERIGRQETALKNNELTGNSEVFVRGRSSESLPPNASGQERTVDANISFEQVESIVSDLESKTEEFDWSRMEAVWMFLAAQCERLCQETPAAETGSVDRGSEVPWCPIRSAIESIRSDWVQLKASVEDICPEATKHSNETVQDLGPVFTSPSPAAVKATEQKFSGDSPTELCALQRQRQALVFYRDTFLSHAVMIVRARLHERAALRVALERRRAQVEQLRARIASMRDADPFEKENQSVLLSAPDTDGLGPFPDEIAKPAPEKVSLEYSAERHVSASCAEQKLLISARESSSRVKPQAVRPSSTNPVHASTGSPTFSNIERLAKAASQLEMEITALRDLALVALERLLQNTLRETRSGGIDSIALPDESDASSAQAYVFRRILSMLAGNPRGMPRSALQTLITRETNDPVVTHEIIEWLQNAFILQYNEQTHTVCLFSVSEQNRVECAASPWHATAMDPSLVKHLID